MLSVVDSFVSAVLQSKSHVSPQLEDISPYCKHKHREPNVTFKFHVHRQTQSLRARLCLFFLDLYCNLPNLQRGFKPCGGPH